MQGLAKMAAEGTIRAFWRGNGTNVTKNIPEMVRCLLRVHSMTQGGAYTLVCWQIRCSLPLKHCAGCFCL
jgi:hypothetical protein